jgi:hypothetical protein
MNHAVARALYGALILLILEPVQFEFRAHSVDVFSIDMHEALE